MLNKTTYFTLLLLTQAQLCVAQIAQPSEPQLSALMAFERETEAAAARGDVAFFGSCRC